MSQRVTILHTNDFHNQLSEDQAQTIRRAKIDRGPDVVLIDSGDAISAGNIGFRTGGEPILTLMSDIGYDAMTMGNREFHVAEAVLRHKIGNAGFPVLCANMRYKGLDGAPVRALPVEPYRISVLPCGARVGIIGVTVPMVTSRMTARHVSAYLFDDPVDVVKRIAGELRPKVDILIALTHIGIKADESLAESCTELDLIVSGHTHLLINAGDRKSGVPIVQAGWFGHYYGVVEFNLGAGRPRISRSDILPLKPATP